MTTPANKITAVPSNSYPAHKTISFVEEKAIVNKDVAQTVVKEAVKDAAKELVKDNKIVAEIKKVVVPENSKPSYPAHKTIDLGGASLNNDTKKEEPVKQTITNTFNKLDSIAPGLSTNDAVKNVADKLTEQPVVKKLDDAIQQGSNLLKDKPADQLNSFIQKTTDQVKEQTGISKVDDILKQGTDLVNEKPGNKLDSFIQKTTEQVKEQSGIQKVEDKIQNTKNTVNDKINQAETSFTSALHKVTGNNSYPDHKTITLQQPADIQTDTTPVNTLRNVVVPPVTGREPVNVIENKPENKVESKTENTVENKQEVTAPVKTTLPVGSYPAHKTHYFVKEEASEQLQNPAPAVTLPDSNERVSPEPQQATLKTVPVQEHQAAAKGKKPMVWIAASAVLLLSSAGTAWYAYQQKKTMQEEIFALKQNNEALAENVKKLQKELHIDDIIARAGKLDTKNNIVVAADVNGSEIVRSCFSITPNTTAKMGKKTVYVRLLDNAGNVLVNGKDNVFEYKGEKIPYSAKSEVNFIGREMMLCIDYKPAEKLQKGSYKAEIYNDGVLDGTSTFELK